MPGGRRPDPVLTHGEESAVRAYLEAGSVKAAADMLNLAEQTVRNQLMSARKRAGVATTAQLVAKLGLRI